MSDSENVPETKSSFGRLAVGADTIAYHRHPGRSPGIVFIGGFRSDMTRTKATFLEALARDRGQAFLRFAHFGPGASSGRFRDAPVSPLAAQPAGRRPPPAPRPPPPPGSPLPAPLIT